MLRVALVMGISLIGLGVAGVAEAECLPYATVMLSQSPQYKNKACAQNRKPVPGEQVERVWCPRLDAVSVGTYCGQSRPLVFQTYCDMGPGPDISFALEKNILCWVKTANEFAVYYK